MSNPTTQTPPPTNDQNQQPVDERTQRITKMWKAFAGIWTMLAIGLCGYWMYDESGLSEMICGWQAKIMDGSCYVWVNFVGAFLVLMLPVIVGQFILKKVTGVDINDSK